MTEEVNARKRELLGFVVVGGIGFAVDALSFMAVFHWLALGHYTSRAIAFVLAVSVTWILNRTFTFRVADNSRLHSEYVTYFASQSVGALVNFGVFGACLSLSETMKTYPVIALMMGSGVAMVVNFVAMKWVVFKPASNNEY